MSSQHKFAVSNHVADKKKNNNLRPTSHIRWHLPSSVHRSASSHRVTQQKHTYNNNIGKLLSLTARPHARRRHVRSLPSAAKGKSPKNTWVSIQEVLINPPIMRMLKCSLRGNLPRPLCTPLGKHASADPLGEESTHFNVNRTLSVTCNLSCTCMHERFPPRTLYSILGSRRTTMEMHHACHGVLDRRGDKYP